jgi:carbamate kinase
VCALGEVAADLIERELVHPALVGASEVERHLLDGGADQEEVRRYLAEGTHFAAGSMKPKMEAVIEFLDGGGSEAIITDPPNLARALKGETGTRVVGT